MPDDDPDDDRAERDCEALAEEVARLEEANAFLLRQWRSALADLGRYARPGETRASLEARVDRAVGDSLAWLKQKQGA